MAPALSLTPEQQQAVLAQFPGLTLEALAAAQAALPAGSDGQPLPLALPVLGPGGESLQSVVLDPSLLLSTHPVMGPNGEELSQEQASWEEAGGGAGRRPPPCPSRAAAPCVDRCPGFPAATGAPAPPCACSLAPACAARQLPHPSAAPWSHALQLSVLLASAAQMQFIIPLAPGQALPAGGVVGADGRPLYKSWWVPQEEKVGAGGRPAGAVVRCGV